jgi:ABC-type uncharacterized transport system substrate-binding protein
VAEFRDAAAEMKLEIVAVPVKSREEAKKALAEIPEKAQALWLIRDPTVLTRNFFNQALVLQLQKSLPLIAYSPQFVRKGAFVSYSAGYPRQGRKAAEIVKAILQGKSISELNVAHPEGTLTVNMNTGGKLRYIVPTVWSVIWADKKGVVEIEGVLDEDQK